MADIMWYLHMNHFIRFSTTGDATFKSDFSIFRSEAKKSVRNITICDEPLVPSGVVQTLYQTLPSGTILIKPTWLTGLFSTLCSRVAFWHFEQMMLPTDVTMTEKTASLSFPLWASFWLHTGQTLNGTTLSDVHVVYFGLRWQRGTDGEHVNQCQPGTGLYGSNRHGAGRHGDPRGQLWFTEEKRNTDRQKWYKSNASSTSVRLNHKSGSN